MVFRVWKLIKDGVVFTIIANPKSSGLLRHLQTPQKPVRVVCCLQFGFAATLCVQCTFRSSSSKQTTITTHTNTTRTPVNPQSPVSTQRGKPSHTAKTITTRGRKLAIEAHLGVCFLLLVCLFVAWCYRNMNFVHKHI